MIRMNLPRSCRSGIAARADVEHRLAQPADELVGDGGQRAAVGDPALDALGDDLVVGVHLGLEVAVLGVGLLAARGHRAERAHAAVGLVLLAVDEDQVARALVAAREQRADHHRVGAGDDRLGDVAGVLQSAVGDHRHSRGLARQPRVVHGGDLGCTDTGDDTGGADRARPDADLDRVGAGVDERLGAGARRDVAADHLDVPGGRVALEPLDHVEQQPDVAVGGVGDEHVHARLDERGGALPGVAEVADRCSHHERPSASYDALGNCSDFTKSLTVIRPVSLPCGVDDREPLALVLAQQPGGLVALDALGAGDQRHRGHHVADAAAGPLGDGHEPQVAVGDDAEQGAVLVDDGEAGDAVLAADLVELLEGGLGADRDGVGDHAGLGALDQVDLVGLVLDREVAVQHAEAALPGHRDRHARLGHGVHRARDERDPEVDLAGQPGRGVDVAGDHVGLARAAGARRRTSGRRRRTCPGHPPGRRGCRGRSVRSWSPSVERAAGAPV